MILCFFLALKIQRSHDVFKNNLLVVYDGGKNAYAPRPINIPEDGKDWFELRLMFSKMVD